MPEYVPYFRKRPDTFEKFKLAFHLSEEMEVWRRALRDEEILKMVNEMFEKEAKYLKGFG